MARRVGPAVGVGALLLLLTGCTGTPADVGDPVVEFTAPHARSYDGEVRVAVHPLHVDGRSMELRLTLTPLGGDDTRDHRPIRVDELVDRTPVLSDVRTLTTYDVLGAASGPRHTAMLGAETVVGEPVVYQAWFAAPDDQVQTLDLVVDPSWGSVLRVPVVRG
ncbi:hypothetical protein [Cellulomonas wangsupingiae]|uniref:Lipoprotein n=1 Tax=Cellulomonas wangsupingiae TaxID=2968085 RepID=A0ABY5K715_9CELL|nr:hypothetical protein [Cellulomonas wangsupingiae]MCC2334806.1 hypothetical protein [Cellulomonas wangsupingiae]UUI66241.1 hypothetical protein NP075_05865 [Cellulomonas wangsupingiae]